jgi:hypothetical protein
VFYSPNRKPFPFLVQIVLQLQDLQIVALELLSDVITNSANAVINLVMISSF